MGAIELHARASADFEAKLEQTQSLLIRAASGFAPVVQASSLGAEDVVITHLIDSLELGIPVFVLDTGMLHSPTLQLLERTHRKLGDRLTVYQPSREAVIQFVKREGGDAMYRSVELRKACCGLRKLETFIATLRRVGHDPFKAAANAARFVEKETA
jgi:phosphoadenosine phosphosulfate reductase